MLLGLAYEEGDVVDEDGEQIGANFALAGHFLDMACKNSSATACVFEAQLYMEGKLKSKASDLLVIRILQEGCSFGQGGDDARLACAMAGERAFQLAMTKMEKVKNGTSRFNREGRKLLSIGLPLLEKACQMGDQSSCKLLLKIQEAVTH
jgi:TPR repeat protein